MRFGLVHHKILQGIIALNNYTGLMIWAMVARPSADVLTTPFRHLSEVGMDEHLDHVKSGRCGTCLIKLSVPITDGTNRMIISY